MLTPSDLKRYQRHLVLPEVGEAGQQKLKAAKVLVVGAGGLGSPSALYLAASGIGTLGLVDLDTVDVTNLQRQVLYATTDIGRGKTQAARERLLALNPDLNVVEHAVELGPDNVMAIFGQYDLVLDGTDRIGTRYLVNDACVLLRKPLVSAAIHRFEGQAMTYVPGKGPCYRCLYPEPSSEIPNCATAGVLGVLPGVLGTLQATEAIKLVCGIGMPLVGRLLTYDALDLSFREFTFKRRPDCAVCGDTPTITTPIDRDRPAGTVRSVSATELKSLLKETVRPFTLVDVRDPDEFAAGHLPGAINIPVNDLERRLAELARYEDVMFVCLSGKRSQAACAVALRGGLRAPGHLEGGMLAWQEVRGDG
jgi:molybdopterin/thiamine biosynthesis adenylyltransferase/rhodanese-related sulfurtransferase